MSALAEMYIEGVSTRKVKKITEELCGHSFSASAISGVVAKLDEQLEAFPRRRLEEPYPYLMLDARYEKVREGGVIRSQAVLVAVGIGADGPRSVIGVELANRESQSSWWQFLEGLLAPQVMRLLGLSWRKLLSLQSRDAFPSGGGVGCRASKTRKGRPQRSEPRA